MAKRWNVRMDVQYSATVLDTYTACQIHQRYTPVEVCEIHEKK